MTKHRDVSFRDVAGTTITKGSKVAFGADNGSTLYVGFITKITDKLVHITALNPDGALDDGWNYRRYHNRVAIIRDVFIE